jgi:hypothetical protein
MSSVLDVTLYVPIETRTSRLHKYIIYEIYNYNMKMSILKINRPLTAFGPQENNALEQLLHYIVMIMWPVWQILDR